LPSQSWRSKERRCRPWWWRWCWRRRERQPGAVLHSIGRKRNGRPRWSARPIAAAHLGGPGSSNAGVFQVQIHSGAIDSPIRRADGTPHLVLTSPWTRRDRCIIIIRATNYPFFDELFSPLYAQASCRPAAALGLPPPSFLFSSLALAAHCSDSSALLHAHLTHRRRPPHIIHVLCSTTRLLSAPAPTTSPHLPSQHICCGPAGRLCRSSAPSCRAPRPILSSFSHLEFLFL
jgi:hypothetical protein